MSRIEQIVMTHFNNVQDLNLKNLINFLEENDFIRYQIYRDMERKYRREDVLNAVEEYNDENDTEISFEEDEIADIVEKYEDNLDDMSNWRWCLNNAITPWIEEKIND